ncbi:MAG: hypothetical protein SNJ78_02930 [Spirochaetales bacterium]
MNLLAILTWIVSLVAGVVLAKGILILVELAEEARELYEKQHPRDSFIGLAE